MSRRLTRRSVGQSDNRKDAIEIAEFELQKSVREWLTEKAAGVFARRELTNDRWSIPCRVTFASLRRHPQ